jgi:hypothetical protein
MRRSLVAVTAAVAAVVLVAGCGGGDDDDDAGDDPRPTTTEAPDPVDVSTPEAVVSALADAGIACSNLVNEGAEDLALFGIDGTQSSCTLDGETMSIVIVTSDQELSDVHALLTDIVGFTTDETGQPIDTITWLEVDHTVVNFENPRPDEATRLGPIRAVLGGQIESVTAVDQPA